MPDIRRVKVVITGYYDVNMDTAQEMYETTDPDKMLEIDQINADDTSVDILEWFDEDPKVALSWEN